MEEAQPKPAGPTADDLHKAHAEFSTKEKEKRAKASALAEALTSDFANRELPVKVGKQEIILRYPGRELRRDAQEALAAARRVHATLSKGERLDEATERAAERAVCDAASRLVRDETMTPEWFQSSEYGIEIALSLLFAVEAAFTAHVREAASFRRKP